MKNNNILLVHFIELVKLKDKKNKNICYLSLSICYFINKR